MKILLVYSNFRHGIKPLERSFPLGLCYIGGILRDNNFDVKIADLSFESSQKPLVALIKEFKPDIVGISCLTQNYLQALKLAGIAKKINHDCVVVFGGIHTTYKWQEILNCPDVDMAILGEGEQAMLELCQALDTKGGNLALRKIKGLAFKENGQIIVNEPTSKISNLDDLPYPAFDLVAIPKLESYFDSKRRILPILTSRGCPNQCVFCSTSVMHGKYYRARKPEKIVDEIEYDIKKYAINGLYIVDDLFTFDRKRAEQICGELINRKIDIKWGCSARVDSVTPDLLKLMKKAGCEGVFFGVESLDDDILKLMKKGFTAKESEKAVEWALNEGLIVDTSFIVGFPGDTLSSLRKIAEFVSKLKVNGRVLTNNLQILPGSEMYAHPESFGIKLSTNYDSDWFTIKSYSKKVDTTNLLKEIFNIKLCSHESKNEDSRLYEVPKLSLDIADSEILKNIQERALS